MEHSLLVKNKVTKHAAHRLVNRSITEIQTVCIGLYGEEYYQGNGEYYLAIPKHRYETFSKDADIIWKMFQKQQGEK